MAFGYLCFIIKFKSTIKGSGIIALLILVLTSLIGYLNGDLKSSLMVNLSLIAPFVISVFNINYLNITRQTIIASIINLLMINYVIADSRAWNSNSLAFMIFCGLSVGMIWFKVGKGLKNIIASSLFLAYGSTALFMTGCRNAGMVIIACFILLILPSYFYKIGVVFRGIYICVMLSTIFAADFMIYVLSDDELMSDITAFTTSFSHKAWGMDTHLEVLLFIKSRLNEYNIFRLLFGSGIKTFHCHNLFYQCVIFYGYIGTLLIYLIYVYIFECALKLIKKYNDKICLSCFIILVGHFMMQIGEVYMLGSESIVLMALLPAGIILQRKRILCKS